jgi:hypothetical protein
VTPGAGYSEDGLVEQPALALLTELGWTVVNAWAETFGPDGEGASRSSGEKCTPVSPPDGDQQGVARSGSSLRSNWKSGGQRSAEVAD